MSNRLFSTIEIEVLSKNPYVKNVTPKVITYTDDFKKIFITENQKGKFPREIFESHGFDIQILGMKRIESFGKRWRAAYRKRGTCDLVDTRAYSAGRPNEKNLSLEEKYKRLEAQNQLLKAENELLKKIKRLERGLKVHL